MKQEDTTEYLTAFAVGAAVGIGAALLLTPKPPTRRERIMKEIKPYRKKISKRAGRARKAMQDKSQDTGEKVLDVSRAVVDDMREEVAAMVAEARAEIADAVADQLDSAQKHLKKTAKRVRS